MTTFFQLVFNTLQIGSIYVLFALGLTLIFGVMNIVNFAHGAFFTAAALVISSIIPLTVSYSGLTVLQVYPFALIIAVHLVAAIGFVVYWFGFRYYMRDLIGSFVLSIGILFVLNGLYLWIWGGTSRVTPDLIEGVITVFGATITTQRFFLMLLAWSLAFGLSALLQFTNLGLGLRAIAADPEAAMLQGMSYNKLSLYGFLIGSVLAGLAGTLAAPSLITTPTVGDDFLIKAFIIIIIGGLGSVNGAIITGLIIAFIESVGGYFFDLTYATLAMFVFVILVLLVRPEGILKRATPY